MINTEMGGGNASLPKQWFVGVDFLDNVNRNKRKQARLNLNL